MEPNTKSVFVAIVGRPNVGKSTLLNALIGEKIAIVTNRPQTTRTRITGILTEGETQYVFIDTPGIHKPRTKLSEYMVKQVSESVADVDVTVFVTEPEGELRKAESELLDSIAASRMPCILAINKIDTVPQKEKLMARIAELTQRCNFDAVVPISAKQNDGLGFLMEEIGKFASPGPHYFAEDSLTDQPERVIVGEILREKLLLNLKEEIPHGTAVSVEIMKEREGGRIIDIEAVILCERASHKGIIIGKQGAMLKKIASAARTEIESFLDCKINLQCWVKVKDDWRNSEFTIRSLGYK